MKLQADPWAEQYSRKPRPENIPKGLAWHTCTGEATYLFYMDFMMTTASMAPSTLSGYSECFFFQKTPSGFARKASSTNPRSAR
jgi:hypothetical protein